MFDQIDDYPDFVLKHVDANDFGKIVKSEKQKKESIFVENPFDVLNWIDILCPKNAFANKRRNCICVDIQKDWSRDQLKEKVAPIFCNKRLIIVVCSSTKLKQTVYTNDEQFMTDLLEDGILKNTFANTISFYFIDSGKQTPSFFERA